MAEINEFDSWSRRLDGEDVGCEDGKPQSGYYRMGNTPVAIWRKGDAWAAKVGLKTITDELKIFEAWERCHAQPVSYEVWLDCTEHGKPWPDQHPVVLEMPRKLPEAFELLRADVEKLVSTAALLDIAKDDDESSRAAELASALGKLEKKADDQRREAKKPHDEAGKAVDELWRPLIVQADKAKRDIKSRVIEPYLKRKAEAARAAAASVGAKHDGKASTKGGAVALRTYTVVVIESPADALRHFATFNQVPPDILEAVEMACRRMASAGIRDIPGVKITTEQRAA